jgi:hypothetical protein
MNRPKALLQCTVVLCVAANVAPRVFAGGTGIPLFGNPIAGTSRTISRQIVKMESRAGLLVGRPSFGSIAMITAYAPGCVLDGVVIQEKAEGDSTLLQIVAPSCLRERLVQATLFLRNGTPHVRFARSGGGGWVESRLQPMPASTASGPLPAFRLPAVVVHDLGPIQLLEEHPSEPGLAGLQLSWTADLRTRISRAAWHFLWPTVTLVIFVLLSWMAHRIATLGKRG